MKKEFLLTFYLLFLYLFQCFSQSIPFHHLTTDNGLSHNSVVSIYQDERDFMWFATANGLSLYNGKDFKIYQKEKDNPNSIQYNDIYQILGDRKGHLYILTNRGASEYDISEDKFTHLTTQDVAAGFFTDSLYIATSYEIFKYNGSKLRPVYKLNNQRNIRRLLVSNDSIFIGTNRGLYLLTPSKELQTLIPNGHISDIFKDSKGCYWVAARSGEGAFRIQGKQITHFVHDPNNPTSISSNFVHRFCEDPQGNIWIGTFNGLNKYNPTSGQFRHYEKQQTPKSLSYSSIWSLYCDRQGNIWVGTYFGGVNYFNPKQQVFREYQPSPIEEEGLSSSIVSRITEDIRGNLWIGTEGGGVNFYNKQTQTYKWYTLNKSDKGTVKNNIKALYYDPKQEILWMGIHMGGLYKLDIKTDKGTRYLQTSHNLPSNNVESILPYQGKLLVATDNGIVFFDPTTEKCERFFKSNEMYDKTRYSKGLVLDSRGILWIIRNNSGVCSYNPSTDKLSTYKVSYAIEHSLSSNSINSIYEDSQHRLWFCTNEDGLDLYHAETDNFENLDARHNGLASNIVYNICELDSNKLLVTTDKGLSILNYKEKTFKNYNQLPLSCLNENALYKTREGEIIIGGTQGAISFHKQDLKQESRSYNILPYRLFVNGREVKVGDKSKILKQDISFTKEITLRAGQNIFSIEYTTTDFLPFNKANIIYRLEGFSRSWNDLKQNTITYSNLSPGKYTLIVKAENTDETLVPPSRLTIRVLPPFYLTVWAYVLYFIILVLAVWYLNRVYKSRIRMQEMLKYEKKHADDIEQMNQFKLRFFTNISHEFRTPLSLIIGQMEMLLSRQLSPEIYNKLLGTYKSCLQLKGLVTELLDFRKQEQGYMNIKVSEYNIVDFVYEHYLLFADYAKLRNITFTFEKSHDDIPMWYDAKQMQKVMNNLISNAFKYTPDGGRISISVRKRGNEVIIEVTDNGQGIAPKDIERIFDRFYQADHINSMSQAGSGIGLSLTKGIVELHHGTIEVFSKEGEGSTFCIHLKTGNEHFTPEQICTQQNCQDASTGIDLKEYNQYKAYLDKQEIAMQDNENPKEKYKILIVEDNDSLREMLVGIFESFYTVVTATNGKEGLEKVRTEQPNIVLSDIVMPEMSGTELCHAIKKDFDLCHIPVVLLTAKTAIEYNMEGLKMGADDYVTKPFNINLLLSRCNNLVNSRIMLQEKFCKQPQTDMQILATNTLDKKFLDQAMAIIEEEIDNADFNVDQLATRMGIARTKLFTKLKAVTGQTPNDLIITIRLKRAAYMLKNNPELNISEIADRTGFNIPKYFSKCFKEKYHINPTAYRKGTDASSPEDTKEDEENDKE